MGVCQENLIFSGVFPAVRDGNATLLCFFYEMTDDCWKFVPAPDKNVIWFESLLEAFMYSFCAVLGSLFIIVCCVFFFVIRADYFDSFAGLF